MNNVSTEILFEKFEIIECLKKDSNTSVYIANHIYLGKKIILKTLNTNELSDKTILGRFKREAKILARLDHPNLIKVLDFGTYQNYFYLSFEYFDSRNLRAIIKFNNLSNNEKSVLLIQLLKALNIAHQNRIIHRDIKPENILVNSNLELKIADFGLAVVLNETALTHKASIVGTPSYMSPEQIRGEELKPQSDLFSSGIVAYELYTNTNPFLGKDISQTINNVLNFNENEIAANIQNLPENVQNAIKSMLRKSLRNRVSSAGEILKSLGVMEEIQNKITKEFVFQKRKKNILFFIIPFILVSIFLILWRLNDINSIPFNSNETKNLNKGSNNYFFSKPNDYVLLTERQKKNLRNGNNEESVSNIPGELFIECLPWAEVYVDNKKLDTTPLKSGIALAPGLHTLRLVHPDYPAYTRKIKINSNKTDSVSVNFNSVFGFLDCKINPWGNIYINGKLYDTTPLIKPLALSPGTYKLTITNPDFGKKDTTVMILAKQTIHFSWNFNNKNKETSYNTPSLNF